MPLQHQLLHSLMVQTETDIPVVKEMKQSISTNLSTRYTTNRAFLMKAALLDPRFKSRAFLDEGEKYELFNSLATEAAALHESTPSPVIKSEPMETALPTMPSLPQLPQVPPDTQESQAAENKPEMKVPSTMPVEIQEVTPPKPGGFADIFSDSDLQITLVEKKTALEMAADEIRTYKLAPALGIQDNPLHWWRDREYKLPLLAKLARKVLCIPATSVPSERVFSTAGDIVSAQRSNLKSEHVDKLIFLKKNMQ